jgi:hypothetical protein
MDMEVFEVEAGRWAYRVGGVYQEWHPDLEGYTPMSQTEATDCAAIVATRLAGA